MPSSLQERMTLNAISPRFATSIFLNMALFAALPRPNGEEFLAVFDRLAVFDERADDLPGHVRLDLVHQLHRLDNANHCPLLDEIAYRNKSFRRRRRRLIEGSDDWRLDVVELFLRFL